MNYKIKIIHLPIFLSCLGQIEDPITIDNKVTIDGDVYVDINVPSNVYFDEVKYNNLRKEFTLTNTVYNFNGINS